MPPANDRNVRLEALPHGSYTPLITPFVDGAIDFARFEQLVDRQAREGSRGVVVTGTTGEPTSLTAVERSDLARRAVNVAGGRMVVIAATGSANHDETIMLTAHAEAAGADAALVVVPAFVGPNPDGLVTHFVAVAKRTSLPVIVYNIPGRAATAIDAESMLRIVERCPNVIGLKHASTDLDLVSELLASTDGDLAVFCGAESLSYPMLAVGARGLMNAGGNLFPSKVQGLCDSVRAGEHGRALVLHRALFSLARSLFLDTNPVPLKAIMAAYGLAPEEVRLPLCRLGDHARERLSAVIDEYREHPILGGPAPLRSAAVG